MIEQQTEEFPGDYTVPARLFELVNEGKLVETSWHNDICPSFAPADGNDGALIQLWADHPNPKEREMPEWPRYRVCTGAGAVNDAKAYYEGDDLDEALRVLFAEAPTAK